MDRKPTPWTTAEKSRKSFVNKIPCGFVVYRFTVDSDCKSESAFLEIIALVYFSCNARLNIPK